MAQQSNEIAIFCCYAREDEKLLDELRAHLSSLQRQKVISVWHDGDISAGAEWELEVKEHLSNANIILLLISSDFIRSDYCYSTEMRHALERHQRREATVIPIILRPVHGWEKVPPGNIQLGQLQALPKDAEPVMGRSDREKAWKEVAGGIERAVNELSTRESAPSVKDSTPPEVLTPEKMSVAASDELNRVKREKSPKLDDSLSSDNGQWFVGPRNGGSCTFKGSWIFGAKAYYVETLNKDYLFYKGLHEYHRAINDLLLEVRMRIVKGNEGGLIFRWQKVGQADEFYYFYITTSGFYGLIRGEPTRGQDQHRHLIHPSLSELINKDSDQNTIAVRASGNTIDLFANGTFLNRFSEAIPDAGQFGFVSGRLSKVAFSYAKMWQL